MEWTIKEIEAIRKKAENKIRIIGNDADYYFVDECSVVTLRNLPLEIKEIKPSAIQKQRKSKRINRKKKERGF